jgi:hypothetical protein
MNLSAPFVIRPIATTLLTIGLILVRLAWIRCWRGMTRGVSSSAIGRRSISRVSVPVPMCKPLAVRLLPIFHVVFCFERSNEARSVSREIVVLRVAMARP